MTTETLTLTDFLLARIAGDESEARKALHPEQQYGTPWHWRSRARLLAECEAKRRIVALHWNVPNARATCRWCITDAPCPTLRALALPYADHPDYREEWKP